MTQEEFREELSAAVDSLACLRGQARGLHLDLAQLLAPAIGHLLSGEYRGEHSLVGRSERNPLLTKYCLWYDCDSDIEVRLNHYPREGYSLDSLHNHKWKFASLVLSGAVDHYVFREGSDDPLDGFAVRHRRGDSYFLGEHLLHCFVPLPQSVTLMFRGPRQREVWFRRDISGAAAGRSRMSDELKADRVTLTEDEYRAFFATFLPDVLSRAGWCIS
jgi:hypothetical protein